MIEFTMKIETEDETLFRKVMADNPRQAIEITTECLCWIVGEDEPVFSVSVDKIDGLPAKIELPENMFGLPPVLPPIFGIS